MLRGEQVYIRALEQTDLDRTHEWVNRPDIIDALSLRAPTSRLAQERWFERLAGDSAKVVFAICETATGKHIGNVSLRDIDTINRNAMFSIFIADREERGHGAGREAAELALRYAFSFLNLHKVYLKTASTNEPALRMYRSLGFEEEGRLREHEYKNGKYVDKVLLGVLGPSAISERME